MVLLSRLSNSRSPHNRGLVKVVASIVQAMEKEMREKKMNSVMGVRAGIHTGNECAGPSQVTKVVMQWNCNWGI